MKSLDKSSIVICCLNFTFWEATQKFYFRSENGILYLMLHAHTINNTPILENKPDTSAAVFCSSDLSSRAQSISAFSIQGMVDCVNLSWNHWKEHLSVLISKDFTWFEEMNNQIFLFFDCDVSLFVPMLQIRYCTLSILQFSLITATELKQYLSNKLI